MQGIFTRTLCLLALSSLMPVSVLWAQAVSVSGVVYVDHDANTAYDGPDYAHPVITVIAFEDADNNGIYDAGENLLGSSITNAFGQFSINGITTSETEFTIAIDGGDLVPNANLVKGKQVLSRADHTNVTLSFQGENVVCYAVADESNPSGEDHLVAINRISGTSRYVGLNGAGYNVKHIEAISFDIGANQLLGIDGDRLGVINPVTGTFSPKPNILGTASHPIHGYRTLDDADGMSFDPFTGQLYGTDRDVGAPDALFLIDTHTGTFIKDGFGVGVDYVLMDGPGFLEDIDDIAISPIDGHMYAINNNDGYADVLVGIDKKTGAGQVIGVISYQGQNLNDVEGFGFTNTGLLAATTGEVGNPANSMFLVDLISASADMVGTFSVGSDFEGCDCLTQRPNGLTGTVFFDADENGLHNESVGSGEYGIAGQKLFVFLDDDADGVHSINDVLVDSTFTDGNGDYDYQTSSNKDFVIGIDRNPFPIQHDLTTDDEEYAEFGSGFGGIMDPDNDFGLGLDGILPVELGSLSVELVQFDGVLKWTTFHEINSDVFMVERSLDGMIYEVVGKVKSFGTTQKPQAYQYEDKGIARADVPVIYYRIKQLDFDGTHEYTQVVELIPEIHSRLALVAQNPVVDGNLKVEYASAEEGSMALRVLNAAGQQVYDRVLSNDNAINQVNISTSNWVPGIYYVYLTQGQERIASKLAVN